MKFKSSMFFQSRNQAFVETQRASVIYDMLSLHHWGLLGKRDFEHVNLITQFLYRLSLRIRALLEIQELLHDLVMLFGHQIRHFLRLFDQELTRLFKEKGLQFSDLPVVGGLDLANFLGYNFFDFFLLFLRDDTI